MVVRVQRICNLMGKTDLSLATFFANFSGCSKLTIQFNGSQNCKRIQFQLRVTFVFLASSFKKGKKLPENLHISHCHCIVDADRLSGIDFGKQKLGRSFKLLQKSSMKISILHLKMSAYRISLNNVRGH